MRHRVRKLQINRFTSWRKATAASMVRNLLIYQSIRTTKSKALQAKPLAEKLISLAKENSLAARRRAFAILQDHALVSRLFKEGGRFASRSGGYTRILNLGARRGDNASMVVFELTEIKKKEIRPKNKKDTQKQVIEAPVIEATGEEPKTQEPKPDTKVALKEKPPITKKPTKNFLGGLRKIFKRERNSL